jgi:hypothetical protein
LSVTADRNSVQPEGGILRVIMQFSAPRRNPASKPGPRPAHLRLTLSRPAAGGAGPASHPALLSAGEAQRDANQPATGLSVGLFLVLLGGLVFSVLMLRDGCFGKPAGVTGLLANGIHLFFFRVLAFGAPFYTIPPVLAASFRMAWYLIIAFKPWRLSGEEP